MANYNNYNPRFNNEDRRAQGNRYEDRNPHDAVDEFFPNPRYNNRNQNNNNRGRNNNQGGNPRPQPQANTRPPRQQPAQNKGGSFPKPKNLSTTPSAPKNDPLHMEALLPNPGQESRPLATELLVYPGFFSLSNLNTETHRVICAIDTSVSRKIPESAFSYYTAVLATARLFKILKMSGRRITAPEESFMDMVYAGDYQPPESIAYYLKGFGNTKIQNQRELRFRARPREAIPSEDGSIGWFGRIDANTHYLYAAYPCLPIYIKRIQADIAMVPGEDPDWDLPIDISPEGEDVGFPTENLLGYKAAQRLSPTQMTWLINAGFDAQGGFHSEHPDIPLMNSLMSAVQSEINYSRIKTSELPSTSEGSLAQTVVTELSENPVANLPACISPMIAKHALDTNGSLVVAAKSLRYLPQNMIRAPNTWAVYDFDDYAHVPVDWQESANNLYDGTSNLLKDYCYKTVSFSSEVETRKLVELLIPKE